MKNELDWRQKDTVFSLEHRNVKIFTCLKIY
jgi:hypothetical protein